MNGLYWAIIGTMAVTLSPWAQTVIERGPHFDVHERTWTRNEGGEIQSITNRYTVLQPGLNFFSAADKAWKPTSTQIDLGEVGAVYQKGPFKLLFAPDHNDPVAAVTLTLPDGRRVQIQTIGVALRSGNGEAVWLGELKNSRGTLDGDSIIYEDAFEGLKADVVVRVSVGKYESDVVLREQIAPPQEFGFDGATSTLEIWHRIVEAPEPTVAIGRIQRSDGREDTDQQISFGDMFIGQGTAFLAGPDLRPLAKEGEAIKVAKTRFEDVATNRRYLIERVPYAEAAAHLQTLPEREEASFDRDAFKAKFERAKMVAAASGDKGYPVTMPVSLEWKSAKVRPSMAGDRNVAAITRGSLPNNRGFVMDYTILIGVSNFRFRGDTTYYCTNEVNITGSPVIEGGTVVKFPPYNGVSRINFYGKVICNTSPYAMAVFTADADNSVGETISTNALSDFYGRFNLYFASTNPYEQDLHDIRTGYAYWGLVIYGTNSHRISNFQVLKCWYGIQALDTTIYAHNVLSHGTITTFYGNNVTYRAEHVTANTGHNLFSYQSGGAGALYLTNSLVVKMTNSSVGVTWVNSSNVASAAGIFQTVGAGGHYLASGSPYRDTGTLSLSSNMLGILKRTTTHAPMELTGSITVPTTVTPQAQRDTDRPDLGYHYAPLDYLWGNLSVADDSTLMLTNSVAIGIHSATGTVLGSGARFISEGRPHLLNRIVRHQTVQEQPIIYGTTATDMTLLGIANSPASKPEIFLRFTELSAMAEQGGRRNFCNSTEFNSIAVRDCRFWNLRGAFDPASGASTFALTNNILERCELSFVRSANLHQMTLELRNNYFSRSTLTFNYPSSTSSPPTWTIRDNLFDTVALSATGSAPYVICGYNGYYGTGIPSLSGGNDKSPGGLDFQTGPLGAFYYPATNTPISTNLWTLVDAGSRSASDASLYHFTSRVDQIKDVLTADIGFHYVTVDPSGSPLDADGDTAADYLEDVNGDGYSIGDLADWETFNSQGGLSGTTGLQTFTPIK